jgi:hypothetical protein
VRTLLLLLGACGFSAHAAPDASFPDLHDAPEDASLGPDAAVIVDAPPPDPVMLACSSGTLYQVDVDQGVATSIGAIKTGNSTFSMDAIAGSSTSLYGIPTSGDKLLQIDATSGAVIVSRVLAPAYNYFGFTYAPPGELGSAGVWFAGTDGTGDAGGLASLYTIDAATGTATLVGPFGSGLTVAGDIAWVHGHGLYGSFYGPGCNSTCIESINPTTGTATPLTMAAPTNLLSLSGFRGALWALENNGAVWSVDLMTGNVTLAFTTSVTWADAAN